MRAKWIFPLVVCILLLLALTFRWEQGPTQTNKDLKIIYTLDRWTGQTWIKTYGISNGIILGGEMEPITAQKSIDERKMQHLSSSEAIQYKEDLNKKIQEYEKEKDLHTVGYNECRRLVELNKSSIFDFTGGFNKL